MTTNNHSSIYAVRMVCPAAFGAADAPDVVIPFRPDEIRVINEDVTTAANYVEVSFNGTDVHGRLTPTLLGQLPFKQRATGLWLRRGAGTPNVQVIAESRWVSRP